MFLNSFQVILLLGSELLRVNTKAISTKTKPGDGCGEDTEPPPTAGAAPTPAWSGRACVVATPADAGPRHRYASEEGPGAHALR